MAIHSSLLAWKILWTEKPGRPQSMGSQRVRHDWVTNTLCMGIIEEKWDKLHRGWICLEHAQRYKGKHLASAWLSRSFAMAAFMPLPPSGRETQVISQTCLSQHSVIQNTLEHSQWISFLGRSMANTAPERSQFTSIQLTVSAPGPRVTTELKIGEPPSPPRAMRNESR